MKTLFWTGVLLFLAISSISTVQAAFDDMPEKEKSQALENFEKWKKLDVSQQNKLKENWNHYKGLTPEQQQKINQRYDLFTTLTPEKKAWIQRRAAAREKRHEAGQRASGMNKSGPSKEKSKKRRRHH